MRYGKQTCFFYFGLAVNLILKEQTGWLFWSWAYLDTFLCLCIYIRHVRRMSLHINVALCRSNQIKNALDTFLCLCIYIRHVRWMSLYINVALCRSNQIKNVLTFFTAAESDHKIEHDRWQNSYMKSIAGQGTFDSLSLFSEDSILNEWGGVLSVIKISHKKKGALRCGM